MSLSPPKLGSVQMPAQTEQDVIAEEKDEKPKPQIRVSLVSAATFGANETTYSSKVNTPNDRKLKIKRKANKENGDLKPVESSRSSLAMKSVPKLTVKKVANKNQLF